MVVLPPPPRLLLLRLSLTPPLIPLVDHLWRRPPWQTLQAQVREAEEEARRQATDAQAMAATVHRLKQELDATREQASDMISKLREEAQSRGDELRAAKEAQAQLQVWLCVWQCVTVCVCATVCV